MKSKKWIAKFAVCFLLAVMCVCTFIACSKEEEKGDLFPEYKPVVTIKEDYKDDYVTLDGKLDEDIWTNSEWHSMQSVRENRNENNNVTVLADANIDAVAVVKENGIYVGIKSNDKVIYVGEDWSTNSSPDVKNSAFGKTGVTMYMTDARNRYRSGKFSYEIGFAADGMVTLGYSDNSQSYSRNPAGKIRTATVCNGGVNTANANGYSVEAFIPWEALAGVDASDAPESIVATFGSHRYNNATPKEAALVWELLDQRYNQGWMQTAAWVEYGASGVREQPEGNVFGTYGDFGYDAAFDVSRDVEGADRAITFTPDPTARRQSRIYVHDIKGTEIYAEAKFTIGDVSTYVDQWPMLGLSFHGDPATVDGETKSCVLHTGITLDLKANNKFNSTYTAPALNGEDFTGKRQFNTSNPFDPTTEDGFKISVYRKGETFYIFYNDKLYDIKSFPYMQADTQTFIGLYVLNLPVTVTDYVFYAGEEATARGEDKIGDYIPKDYVIDGVADAKWEGYKGAIASLKTIDASGKTFTAKAILGSNGLYFIAEAKHEYYFDNGNANWSEWANQYNTPGVAGVTNLAVAIGNVTNPQLHFTVSKYGVYACGGGTGANVIGAMKTTDSGAVGSKTRYTSVAECFVPMPVLEANGGYTDTNKDSVNMQLVFVSYNGTEKDNLETAGNYYTASSTDWKWTWPLAIPADNELNSFARTRYMKVTESGIEYPAAQAASVTKGDDVTVTGIEHGTTYSCGAEITFRVSVADTHVITGITLNGKTMETDADGNYKFIYRGGALDLVVTSIEKNTKVTLGEHNGATVSVAGNDDLTKDYDDGDTVTFTVSPDEYHGIVKVKVNGKEVAAKEGSAYERVFSITEGRFDITVETKIVKADVTFTVADANGTPFDQRFGLKGKKLIFTNKDDSTDTFELTIGENNTTTTAALKREIGTVYSVNVDGDLYNFSLADITIEGSVQAITLKLKSNLTIGSIANENGNGYNVTVSEDGLSVTDITGNRPSSEILFNNADLAGEVWFGARFKSPKAELRYNGAIAFAFYAGGERKLIAIGDVGGKAGVGFGVDATQALDQKYENMLTGADGLYVAVRRTAQGNIEVYVLDNQTLVKVFEQNNVGTGAVTAWGLRPHCLGLDGRHHDVENLKYGATANDLLGNLLGTVGVQVNNSATDDTATVEIAGNPTEYEFGKTYNFTVAPKSSSYLVTSVTVNGTAAEADNGTYSFVFMGKTEIAVTTAEKGKVTLGAVSDLVNVSVKDNDDLSHEYDSADTVEFTVTLKDSNNEGYYKIIVKINGTAVTGTNGAYSQVYGDTNTFEITVETELVNADAKITVQPRNTGNNGKTDGITLTFTNGSTTFTETADANGVITLTKKPVGTYTVRGKLFGGELKFADVTLNARNNTAEITHNGTHMRYDDGNSAIVDYKTSSIDLGSAANTVLLGTQNITGEVWFTMKITMPSRSDYNNFRFILAPDDWSKRDFVEFLHNGETGFIKLQAENASTLHSADIGTAMNGGNLYVAFARTADMKFKMAWATTADGLKSATVAEYTSKTDGAAIGQIGFTSSASMTGASVKYVSSGATLEAAIAEMNAYEAKDASAA